MSGCSTCGRRESLQGVLAGSGEAIQFGASPELRRQEPFPRVEGRQDASSGLVAEAVVVGDLEAVCESPPGWRREQGGQGDDLGIADGVMKGVVELDVPSGSSDGCVSLTANFCIGLVLAPVVNDIGGLFEGVADVPAAETTVSARYSLARAVPTLRHWLHSA
jgi:hypothetical protein